MKVKFKNFILIVASIYVVIGLICILVFFDFSASAWLDSTVAAWVQAIGSILAIVGALAVSRSQTASQNKIALEQIQHQIDMKKQEAIDRAEAFLAVVDCAATLCDAICKTAAEDESIRTMQLIWDSHLREVSQASLLALRGIPVHELGSYELVVAHGTVLATFVKFVSEVDVVVGGERSSDVPEKMGVFGGMNHQNALMQAGFGTFKDAHLDKHGKLPD